MNVRCGRVPHLEVPDGHVPSFWRRLTMLGNTHVERERIAPHEDVHVVLYLWVRQVNRPLIEMLVHESIDAVYAARVKFRYLHHVPCSRWEHNVRVEMDNPTGAIKHLQTGVDC